MRAPNAASGRGPLMIAVFAACAAAALADPPVAGQLDHGATQAPKFEDWDRNKDGYIAKDEVPAGDDLNAKFALFDANADGKLSRDEFAKYVASREGAGHDKNSR